MSKRWFVGLGILVMLLCLGLAPAWANMPAPGLVEGDRAGDPLITKSQAEIVHETLEFNLAPLAMQQPGIISATYQIHNPSPPAAARFLFISPGILTGQATVNRQPVLVKPVRKADLPAEFTKALNAQVFAQHSSQDQGIAPSPDSEIYLQFQATLPEGDFPIQVQYSVRPAYYEGFEVYRQYQVRYALAPARDWKKFGTLDVSIALPSGWVATTSPPMTQTGALLKASFPGIPADQLEIKTQPAGKEAVEQRYNILIIAGLLIALLLCIITGWGLGRLGKKGILWSATHLPHWRFLSGVGGLVLFVAIAPLCPIIVWLILAIANWLGRLGLPTQHVSDLWNGESGRMWTALLVGFVSVLLAASSFIVSVITFRPSAPKSP